MRAASTSIQVPLMSGLVTSVGLGIECAADSVAAEKPQYVHGLVGGGCASQATIGASAGLKPSRSTAIAMLLRTAAALPGANAAITSASAVPSLPSTARASVRGRS